LNKKLEKSLSTEEEKIFDLIENAKNQYEKYLQYNKHEILINSTENCEVYTYDWSKSLSLSFKE